MRLNRSGANADKRFIGSQTPSWKAGTLVADWCSTQCCKSRARLGSRCVPVPSTDFCDRQESGAFEGSLPSNKLLNLHRMKDFRRGPGTVYALGRTASAKQALRFDTLAAGSPADRCQSPTPPASIRNPKSLKPAPIGDFVEFLLRADKSGRFAPSGRGPSARSCPILYTQSEPKLVPATCQCLGKRASRKVV
jgi:hypothetical protein